MDPQEQTTTQKEGGPDKGPSGKSIAELLDSINQLMERDLREAAKQAQSDDRLYNNPLWLLKRAIKNRQERISTFFKRVADDIRDIKIRVTPEAAAHLQKARDFALVVVDAQAQFCALPEGGTAASEACCRKIENISHIFRRAAVDVIAVYTAPSPQHRRDIDFFKFRPRRSDQLAQKEYASAFFQTRELWDLLEQGKKKSLLVCGFNTNFCVKHTVLDALALGKEVFVMEDLTEETNGENLSRKKCGSDTIIVGDSSGVLSKTYKKNGLEEMAKNGAHIITSAEALRMFGR